MLEIPDPRFSERANAHIVLSNEQCSNTKPDRVALSMMDATAQFNIWLWAATSKDVTQFQGFREQALEGLLQETRARLNKYFDEYVANYDPYIVAAREAEQKL